MTRPDLDPHPGCLWCWDTDGVGVIATCTCRVECGHADCDAWRDDDPDSPWCWTDEQSGVTP